MTTEPTPILDDPAQMDAIDKREMLRLVRELPEQCETALGIARGFRADPLPEKPNVVFMTGVGEAGLACEMAAAVLAEDSDAAIAWSRGGRIPRYVGEQSLVFLVDYAGASPLLLRNFREARARGAEVICVSSGGKLLETASREGVRVVKIPPGQPTRTALGYLIVPLVAVIEKLGLAHGSTEKLSHAVKLMKNVRETLRREVPCERNFAKRTAETLANQVPVIYGCPGYRRLVAERWSNQLGANAKQIAATGLLPDAAEGPIAAWELSDKQGAEFAAVLLADPSDKGETAEIAAAVENLLRKHPVVKVTLQGATTAEKLFHGVYLGDYVSCYLAMLYETDPSRSDNVAAIEMKLSAARFAAEQAAAPPPPATSAAEPAE